MALAVWQKYITDSAGNIIPNATVEVRATTAGFPLASIFSDRNGVDTEVNPFIAEDDGLARFYVEGGAYRITVTSGALSATFEYVAIGTAAETDAGLLPVATPAQWLFDSSTTDSDPGDGEFRLNNASPGSATAAYVDNLQSGGASATAWLDLLDDFGSSGFRGILEIFDASQATTVFYRYQITGSVTDGGGYRKLTLSNIGGQGTLVAGTTYSMVFYASGPVSNFFAAAGGAEGGEIVLERASTSTFSGNVVVDINGDLLRVFESGGTNRGMRINITSLAAGAATDIMTDVNLATAAQVRACTTGDLIVSPAVIETASAAVALTDAATIALDWDAFIYGTVTLTANRALGNPTNGQPGTWRTVMVQGDAASSPATARTLTFGTQYKGDIPTLNDIDDHKWYLLMIFCHTTSHFVVSAKEAKNTLIP